MELAYIAGLFDGEGCVRICRRDRYGEPGNKRKRCEMYYLQVHIVNSDPRLVYPLKERFGGSVHMSEHKNPRQRPTFSWIVSTQLAAEFLKAVRPWLISKADQADIALAFQDAKKRHGKPKAGIDPSYRERERRQYAEISALKHLALDPVDFGMAANSEKDQTGQPRAKQALQ